MNWLQKNVSMFGWTWLQQHPQELLGKGVNLPLKRVHRGLLPLKWPKCFWILNLSGQLHQYFRVSKLCSINFAHMWCCSSLPLLPAHLGGTTLGSSWLTAMFLPHLAPKDTQTEPWQALCQGHIGGMGILPACVGHCLGITACCHAANGLAFLDRESLELEVSKCGCIVVCNPQPKLLSSCTPHRLHMGGFPHLSPGADTSVPSWEATPLHLVESCLWWLCQDRDVGAAGGMAQSRSSQRVTCKGQFSLRDSALFFLSACTFRNSQSFLISETTLSWGQDRNGDRLTGLSLKGTFTRCWSYSVHASSAA